MNSPRVSIVIPSYNCERYIRQTLDSVVAQTFADWELIVVDDQSTDGTVDIASNVDPRIRVVRQSNAGVCAARNRGFAEARGEFLCFLDHDDVWYEQKLARQVAWMDRMPEVGMVYSTCIFWHPDGDRFASPEQMRPPSDEDVLDADCTGWTYHQFMFDCHALTSSAMIRRRALEVCGGFDTSLPYSEDWDLFLRLSREFQFAQMHWPSTLYRQHSSQGSRMPRPVDYRTELLMRNYRRYGLASRDGRHLDEQVFRQRISHFRMEFGRLHLAHGDRLLGIRSLLGAWTLNPGRLRYLALAIAGIGGWRPRT